MIHYKIFLVAIRLISASSIVNPSVDNANALEQITSEIYFQRSTDDLAVLKKTEDNQFVTLNEDEFENFGITKKDEGVFIIESIGLLFFNRSASKLEKLLVCFSNIQRVDQSIQYLNNITHLNLSFNQLSALPENFGNGFKNLKELSISGNQLTKLPDNFGNNLANLEYLNISYNQLTTLPDNFGNGLTNLKYLNLHDNPLSQDQIDKLKNKLPTTEIGYGSTL